MFHVEQNNNLVDIKNCPSCGKSNFSTYLKTKDFFFTQEGFSLSKCKKCQLVFTNPVPNNLSKYYDTPDYLSHNTRDNGLMGILYSFLRKINIKNKYNLIKHYSGKGSILDIGCGTGELLNYFNKNNWAVKGVEPNQTARKFAKQKYCIDIHGEESINSFKPESFDVISMWHVLEHVPDLHTRLIQISKLIKPEGTIFIALPNLDSPDSIKYGKFWSALDVPRHLYHFTQLSFEKLINKHNMVLVHAEPMKLDSYYVSLLSEKYIKNKLYFPAAIINGFISNQKAKKNNNFSSMIFVVKKV